MSGACWYYGGYGDYYPEETCDFFEDLIAENDLNEWGYFIYAATGTSDSQRGQVDIQMEEMLARNDVFTPDHVRYYLKDGGVHDLNAVQEYIYNALPLFFENKYTVDTKISDVIDDPVFDGYGRLIFPVNDGYYSGDTLGELRLAWYNNIDPDKTVEIANYMKSHAAAGDTIFYNIYTEEEMMDDPAKRDTGLFFFKGEPSEKFAVCSAGGGHAYVGAMHDSFPHALELSKIGYNAFAVIYRPGWTEANYVTIRSLAGRLLSEIMIRYFTVTLRHNYFDF